MTATGGFDTATWVRALNGEPPDPDLLLQWRFAPPRIVLQGTTPHAGSVPSWDEDAVVPIVIAAQRTGVSPATVRNRCRRWGIKTWPRVVCLREGGGWPTRQTVLPQASYRALLARTYRLTEAASGPSSPVTTRAS